MSTIPPSLDRAQASPPAAPAARRGVRPLSLAVAALVLAADQLTKALVVAFIDRPIHLLWTLRLVKTYNTGAAFSLGTGLGPIIAVLAVVVVVVLARMGRTAVTTLGVVALGLVMGGALGNLTDRLFRGGGGLLHGAVVDFIDLQWWPVFNVADMAIVIGGVLIAWSGLDRSPR